jgi:hypothetical protein
MDELKSGLVIDEPYISMILQGHKTWEMRSQRTGKRMRIGLIKKGSKKVFGSAELYDCEGPYSYAELITATDKHGISKQQIDNGLLDKWNYAWKLRNIQIFDMPVSYVHPNGAVTWVDLQKAIPGNTVKTLNIPNPTKPERVKTVVVPTVKITSQPLAPRILQERLPFAKDGTNFGPELEKNGIFTIGEKGNEQKFAAYNDALNYLKQMKTAKWRRPNPKGNWGIVSAVEWK